MKSTIPQTTADGATRRVGFELEFTGLELDDAAEIIRSNYGGAISRNHRYRYEITDTSLGTFRVELDARILRRLAEDDTLKKWGLDFKNNKGEITLEKIVDRVAKTVVPIEIVMPPVPIDETDKLESLREALQDHKAEGTGSSLVHAFGMHINMECPKLDVDTILRYLRTFLLLYPWLLKKLKIDLTRKLSPFVDAFPDIFAELVLDPSYNPDMEQFTDDYLLHNSTRNRPLDLMPILALEEPEKVQAALDDEKNNPRATFHYRLPNSRIDDPEWRLNDELTYWMKVEQLAAMPDMVHKLSRLYLLRRGATLVSFRKEWAQTIAIILDLDE